MRGVILTVLLAILSWPAAALEQASCPPDDAARHLAVINAARAQGGKNPLRLSAALNHVAWDVADEFVRTGQQKKISFDALTAKGYPGAVEVNQVMFAVPDLGQAYQQGDQSVAPVVSAGAVDIGSVCKIVPGYFPVRIVVLARRQTDLTQADAPPCEQGFGREVARLTNEYRRSKGLAELEWNDRLAAAAQMQSDYMVTIDRMQHEGPRNNDVGDRAKAQGYDFLTVAENVASGQPTPQDVLQSWIDSPHHNENLLAKNVKDIGVACANPKGVAGQALGKRNIITWTQDFGMPQ